MKKWHAGAYSLEPFEPDTSVVRDDGVEGFTSLVRDGSGWGLIDGS